MSDQTWSAIIPAVAGIVGLLLGRWFEHQRMVREFAPRIQAETVVKKLLNSDDWQKRSFEAIKGRIGGFDDNELRKILVSVGAVKFTSQSGEELWGLVSRNEV
jgi:hypothetical protein